MNRQAQLSNMVFTDKAVLCWCQEDHDNVDWA